MSAAAHVAQSWPCHTRLWSRLEVNAVGAASVAVGGYIDFVLVSCLLRIWGSTRTQCTGSRRLAAAASAAAFSVAPNPINPKCAGAATIVDQAREI